MPTMRDFTFTIVGTGQDSPKIKQLVAMKNVKILDWVKYRKLPKLYADHKLSLGIFGSSEKAKSVFPNKVMESLRVGVPCISASCEIKDYFGSEIGVHLINETDSSALASAIEFMLNDEVNLRQKRKQALRLYSAPDDADQRNSRAAYELISN